MKHIKKGLTDLQSVFLETVGLALITLGIGQIHGPAALVFAGACLVFIAQGMDQEE
jgi:hypothetical protein